MTAGNKGGAAGEWSARKAQMAVQEYKKAGGGYVGDKPDRDNSPKTWTDEEWGTRSGENSGDTGERHLPRKAREALSDEEYRRTTAKKRKDAKAGRQSSAQPADVAEKTRTFRDYRSKSDLYAEAKKRDIPGRSKMSNDALAKAVAG